MTPTRLKTALAEISDHPGVYLFYGSKDLLLYVGKSKTLRSRIRAHFTSRGERWLCRKIRRIEVRETAGELGALLLESRLIKELRPMYNVAARRKRQIVVAKARPARNGYLGVSLEPVDVLRPQDAPALLGIFKHTTQAKEYLAAIARSHRLCPKLLGLEQARTACFSYHLGRCDGACLGKEDPSEYNARLAQAFEERRVKAWPFDGSVVVEEASDDRSRAETFLIDNWCLLSTSGNEDRGTHRFDYDSYKILYAFLTDPAHHPLIKIVKRNGG